MPIYVGRKYTATQTGTRLVEVRCEKCETAYAYELVRTGSGSEEAPYLLGGQRAASSAARQAAKHVEQRLHREAELVPCPKCHWIHEELVAGYRRTRYRGFSKLAFIAAFFGTVICLLWVWLDAKLGRGPMNASDRLNWLTVGPVISVCAGLLCLAFQCGFRQLLQPNSMFPELPRVPIGTPPALIRDPKTDEFVIAAPEVIEDLSNHWLTFQPGRITLPEFCCGCMSPTQTKYQAFGFNETIPTPFCEECQLALTATLCKIGMPGVALASLVVAGGLGLNRWIQNTILIVVVILAIVFPILWWFGIKQVNELPAEWRVIDRDRNLYQIKFRNHAYMRLCLEQNKVQILSEATVDSESPPQG